MNINSPRFPRDGETAHAIPVAGVGALAIEPAGARNFRVVAGPGYWAARAAMKARSYIAGCA